MPSPPHRVPRVSKPLDWAQSKTVGQITEIAVLAPIRKGRIPRERCTYEERLRLVVGSLQARVAKGMPSTLDRVPTIHFGRIMILRPEQYLVGSNVPGLDYQDAERGHGGRNGNQGGNGDGGNCGARHGNDDGDTGIGRIAAPLPGSTTTIPAPIDDFSDIRGNQAPQPRPTFRSWVLTLVSFDGDLKAYFRDIATLLDTDFDLIYRNCDDFPGVRDFEAFWTWIRRYQINVDLFYPRYSDLTAVRIKELQDFRRRFDEFVAEVRGAPDVKRVASMDELFDQFLRMSQHYARNFPASGGTFESGSD